ncbi:beta-ketoacyl synthase N-terminal-like domain-containing protein [Nonomuraea sp. LPB2021202275-12-8]|uniref:beta-ketoacyl synthase N-terminal-like domain-containing protein n=1 Tax=Nonomuraea sp. LPB2021202275-12-8 TaxID=3120159 RepID=UPI00300D4C17
MGGVGDQAVAVVGAGCRLPDGIADLDGLWAALDGGPKAGGQVPGGFSQETHGFDAAYFGMSPDEAVRLDPRHHLLLELAVEALDDAGIDPARLAASDTGVFAGLGGPRAVWPVTAAEVVSRHFDLRGPGAEVDRGCSSSLVALARACHGLVSGDSRVVLAGGVFLSLGQAQVHDGPGEADQHPLHGAMLVLKRLGDALADRDRIHGVLAGWGSGGLGPDLLRQVYERARVDPGDLAYLEAHGTGAPAEWQALGHALAEPRENPLPVRPDPGRLGAASGVVAVLKALLALRHRGIPASPHAEPPDPGVDFEGLRLAPVAAAIPAAKGFVGVNSAAAGGGAHVIVAPAPADLGRPVRQRGPLPVVVSARSEQALAEAARRMAARLVAAAQEEFYDLAYTSCARRGRHPHRRVVLADGPQEAAERLTLGRPAAGDGRVVFVYGEAGEWPGMGADLQARDRAFRSAVERADTALAPHLGWSVAGRLAAPGEWGSDEAWPLRFAVQVGMTGMLAARGITAGATTAHGTGAVAAAWAAGELTLEEAARAVAEPGGAARVVAGPGGGPDGVAGFELFALIGPCTRGPLARPATVVATMDPHRDGVRAVDEAVAELITAGADADWNAFFPRPGRVADLPAYPWRRRRHQAGISVPPARRMLQNVTPAALYAGGVS